MTTLLLRLSGPMQSWGTQSRFGVRDGAHEPSKSGVIGLLCAALGRPRWEPVDDLAALRMGVRVDHEGVARVDYQTAGGVNRRGNRYGVAKASGDRGETVTSTRHYLADATFLVGLEGDADLLARLEEALQAPRWQIYLGRKSYVPSTPVVVGLRDGGFEEALAREAWAAPIPTQDELTRPTLRFVLEASEADGEDIRADQPIGAAFSTRAFGLRRVRSIFRQVGTEPTPDEVTSDVSIKTDPESQE